MATLLTEGLSTLHRRGITCRAHLLPVGGATQKGGMELTLLPVFGPSPPDCRIAIFTLLLKSKADPGEPAACYRFVFI